MRLTSCTTVTVYFFYFTQSLEACISGQCLAGNKLQYCFSWCQLTVLIYLLRDFAEHQPQLDGFCTLYGKHTLSAYGACVAVNLSTIALLNSGSLCQNDAMIKWSEGCSTMTTGLHWERSLPYAHTNTSCCSTCIKQVSCTRGPVAVAGWHAETVIILFNLLLVSWQRSMTSLV